MPVLKRILVATDLSASGQRAVMRAGQLARQWEASLSVLYTKPDLNLFGGLKAATADGYRDVAQAADSFLCRLLVRLEAEFGVHARCDSRLGRASNVIAAMVAEQDPHIVVIGALGEHSSGDLDCRLGGTALKLLTRIERPLQYSALASCLQERVTEAETVDVGGSLTAIAVNIGDHATSPARSSRRLRRTDRRRLARSSSGPTDAA